MDLNEWADWEDAAAEQAWRNEAEAEIDEGVDYLADYDREDFGWFGDEALCGE